jgi:Mn2+/Fe2+ NRAMP family transporter
MIKANKDQKKNDTAVYIGYTICLFLYLAVGVLGALAIYGRVPPMEKESYNIIDYFSGSFQAPVIGFLNFSYLFCVSPIFPFVGKTQALELIPKEKRERIPNIWMKATVVFALIWIPCNTLFIVFDTSPVVVIGFITTVMAFYTMYFLPIAMTFKAGDYLIKDLRESTLSM